MPPAAASSESIDPAWRGSGAGGVRSAIPKRDAPTGGFFKRSLDGVRRSFTGSSSGKDGSSRDVKRSSTSRRRQVRNSLEDHQLKCFTKWWQSVLPPGTHCHDLTIDIQSSFLLVQVLEILSGKPVPNVKRPKKEGSQAANRFATLANFDSCIKYMTGPLGITLINVTTSGLADGDAKQVIIVSCARSPTARADSRGPASLRQLPRCARAPPHRWQGPSSRSSIRSVV